MATLPNFGVQKINIFGTYGEFSSGVGPSKIKAQYLLTKIRPGSQGQWENQLASQMVPWREMFNLEDLSFDELIQRDLNDSRVAHDLIPYLLGESGEHARFFPPVLAVLVPKKADGKSGIAHWYPNPNDDGERTKYGDLFDFEIHKMNGSPTPLGIISYNPQRAGMVIVDGQHRAMAVLALHRQLTSSWGSDPYAPYYSHVQVRPEDVAHIELPVCLIYFPEITEGNEDLIKSGVDLTSVCREIFTVVNKQAKEVSKSRALLLDDNDFPAFMMRKTLSGLKLSRNEDDNAGAAKIYSFSFGDADSDGNSQVMSGRLEYCSAVAIHKMHAATCFSVPQSFNLESPSDVTDGRFVKNSNRPVVILNGTAGEHWNALGRKTAKTLLPVDVDLAVSKLGAITDAVIIPMFDKLRPFAVHNNAMAERWNYLENLPDPIQTKCQMLMFEGSGTRSVFEEHADRLKNRVEELTDNGKAVPAYLKSQIEYTEKVIRALKFNEDEVRENRAFYLFNIDGVSIKKDRSAEAAESDLKQIRVRANSIFDAVSTQAFQIGYLMAVLSCVEKMLPVAAKYSERLNATKFVSLVFLNGMNCFFGCSGTKHRTLTGYVIDQRAKAFDPQQVGFRGLLSSTNVKELSEKQWDFFRYMIFEIVFSKVSDSTVRSVISDPLWTIEADLYLKCLPALLGELESVRVNKYFEAACRASLNQSDFKSELETIELSAKVTGKTDLEIEGEVKLAVDARRKASLETSRAHIKASLGRLESAQQLLKRAQSLVQIGAEADSIEAPEDVDDSSYSTAEPTGIQRILATDMATHSNSNVTPLE
jgi:hypothetical protein